MLNKLWIAVALVTLVACGGNTQKQKVSGNDVTTSRTTDMHNAENSLDYKGVYTGTLPAADAPGIDTRLELKKDGTYTLHGKFIDRDAEYDQKGTYTLSGNTLSLTSQCGKYTHYYKVEENRLRMLDMDKNVITGDLAEYYVLDKI